MTLSTTGSRRFSSLLQYLWPLRVPLMSGAILVGFQWLAFRPGMAPLLSGIFDPVNDWTMAIVTAVALFNAWTVVVIWRLILAYGADRLDLPRTDWTFFPVPVHTWPAGALLAVPVIWRTFAYATAVAPPGSNRFRGMFIATLLGTAVAAGLLVASLWFGERLDRWGSGNRTPPVSARSRMYSRLLLWLSRHSWLSAGFLTRDPTGRRPPRLGRGHGLGFFLALASLALYVVTGFMTRNIDQVLLASALTYVLLLQLVLTWTLGLAAFVLDRSRVPLVVYLLILIVLVDNVIDRVFPSDHIYRTVELTGKSIARPTPSEMLQGTEPAVLVAVSGGGIQAAAWAARVLTDLKNVNGFDSHLRFISAVSGGSVGAMNVLAYTPDCGPAVAPNPNDQTFDAETASQASSLHAAGRGLVFKDLPRTLFPFFSSPFVDRGSQLEDAWKRAPRLRKPYPDPAGTCCQAGDTTFRTESARGSSTTPWLPRPVSRCSSPPSDYRIPSSPSISTSDTQVEMFRSPPPYVCPRDSRTSLPRRAPTPTPRKATTRTSWTAATSTTTAWAHCRRGPTRHCSGCPLRSAQHASSSSRFCDSEVCSGREAALSPSDGGARRGWPYQLVAPLTAIVATRAAAQQVTNRTSLRLLKDLWQSRNVCIESLAMPFGAGEAPLSWHLTDKEKRAIGQAWANAAPSHIAAVRAFLEGRSTGCGASRQPG